MIRKACTAVLFGFITIVLPITGNICFAGTISVAEAFKKDYPAVQAESIEKTEIDGVYEVYAGGNLIYYHQKSGNVLFGEMITRDYRNITAERRNSMIADIVKSLPLDKAIRVGQGKHVVLEVSDIDCAYCRKLEEFFDKRDDVSRYVFLFPLEKIHPDSAKKSIGVLCSKNQEKIYREAVKGLYDEKEMPGCDNERIAQLLDEHKRIAKKLGVQGTPALWINGVAVAGANIPQIEQLLSSNNHNSHGKEVKP